MSRSRSVVPLGLGLVLLAGAANGADRFVSPSGVDTGTCSSSAAPCRSPTHALTQSMSGDTVKISAGSYAGNLLIDSSTSLTISGGWTADFTSRDPVANRTTLRGVTGVPPPCLSCGVSDAIAVRASTGDVITLVLDGLTLRHGARGIVAAATANGVLDLDVANCLVQRSLRHGIEADARDTSTLSIDVSDTVLANNVGKFFAAAISIYNDSSMPMSFSLVDSRVERNRSPAWGAMLADSNGMLTLDIQRCSFSNNRASNGGRGGAFAATNGIGQLGEVDLTIRDSTFTRNRARENGAFWIRGVDFTLSNVTFWRNSHSAGYGGVVEIDSGTGSIVNTTISGNRGFAGLSLGSALSVALTLRNSIVWGHRPTSYDLVIEPSATVDADHSDIDVASVFGTFNDLGGNIDADPLFVSGDDLRLTAASPCVDTGTCTGAPATDAEGDPRPTGTGCDIGADEFVP